MAGFGMIIAGAAEGWSEGRKSEIKAEREARLRELEEARADSRLKSQQEFQSREAAIGRTAQAEENEKSRAVQGTQYGTGEDGTSLMIRDGKATTVTGEDGKPVKLATKAGDKPADQQMVEYLVSLGKTQDEALNWVKTSRTKSDEDTKMSLYKAHIAAGMTPDEAQEETDKVWERYGRADTPKGSTKTQDTEEVVTPANVVPPPAKRVIGKKYMNGKGQMATWTADGWVMD